MPDRLIGRKLGDFQIEDLIGRGAVGRVYKATQLSLHRQVALKVLEEGLFTPNEFRVRFEREAKVIAQLEHPNIIPIYAFGTDDEHMYYAMRLVSGRTLEELMVEGLPLRRGLRYVADTAGALAYAHRHNVVHRDLKPANVMISDGEPLLSDFGLARLLEDSTITASGTLIGTPRYMAPEQAKREKAGPPADIYALGVISYEILAGRHPFEDGEDDAVRSREERRRRLLERITAGQFKPPEGPDPLVRLIQQMMALQPDDRPTAMSAREQLLEAASLVSLGGGTTSIRPPGASPEEGFGKYQLIEKIGEGGMGVVWRARQIDLNRDVAIKFLSFAGHVDETSFVRFRREAQAIARLRHPNIIQIYEAGDHEGRHYFTMEMVDGQSLKELLSKGPVPVRRAMEVLRDVSRAIEHAHDRGVIHRDLKPSNILLNRAGHVFVMDFGLSKTIDQEVEPVTRSGELMGTPAYMAPEQAQSGWREIGPRTDIYGLGALMYHVLTGQAPFSGRDPIQILGDVVQKEPPRPRTLNPKIHIDAETICLKAMEKDPLRRYRTMRDMLGDIERFLSGESIMARPAGAMTRMYKKVQRHPAVSGLLLLIVALVLTGAGVLIAQQVSTDRRVEAMGLTGWAAIEFLAQDPVSAMERARDATGIDPEWGPGWFWIARCELHEYTRARSVPAARASGGELEFDPMPAESSEERALRERVVETLSRARDLEGMAGWESEFAAGVLDSFHERYADAQRRLEAILTEEELPDFELFLYAAGAAYYARDFEAALRHAAAGKVRWGNVPEFRVLEIKARIALGLAERLRGGDPGEHYAAAAAVVAEGRVIQADVPAWDVLEARVRILRGDVSALDLLTREDGESFLARGDARLANARAMAAEGRVDPEQGAEFRAAVEEYDRAVELSGHAPAAYLGRARAREAWYEFLVSVGRPDPDLLPAIVEDYSRVLEVRDRYLDAEMGRMRADVARDLAHLEDRREQRDRLRRHVMDLQALARRHPEAVRARVALGRAWMDWGTLQARLGDDSSQAWESGVEELTRAVEQDDGCVAARIARGDAHARAGHRDEALADYERAAQADASAVEAMIGAARVWIAEGGTYEGARMRIREALQANPRCADAWAVLAEAEVRAGNYDAADAAVREALAIHESHAEALEWSARSAMGRGDLDAAVAAAERSVRANPARASAYDALGTAYATRARLGLPAAELDWEAAELRLRQAVGLDPANDDARLRFAEVLFDRGVRHEDDARLREALEVLERLGDDPRASDLRRRIEERVGP